MTEFRDDPDADRIGSALSRLLSGVNSDSPMPSASDATPETPSPWPVQPTDPAPWPQTAGETGAQPAPPTETDTPRTLLPALIPSAPHQMGPARVRAPQPSPQDWPTESPQGRNGNTPPPPPPPPPWAKPDEEWAGPNHFGRRLFGDVPPRRTDFDDHPIRGTRSILSTLLRQRRRILLSTAIVALGVAYLAGSLSLLGRVSNGLDDLAGIGTERADVVVEGQIAVDSPLEQTRQLVPDALVPLIARLPGVAAVTGRIEDTTVLVGTDLKPIVPLGLTQQPLGANWPTPQSLNPYTFVGKGHAPTTDNQVVIDEGTARRAHLAVGGQVITSAKSTFRTFTIVGIVTLSGRVPPDGSSLALFNTATARALFDRQTDDNSIGIKFAKGADHAAATAAIKAQLPFQTDLVDGPTYERHREILLSKSFQLVRALLIGFAGLALIVGAFTVANSNTLLFARRRQGFAMLRLVGASPGQLGAAALIEATFVGLAAVVVGIPLGLLVGKAIEAALNALGSAIPVAGSPFTPTVLFVSLAVGLGVTTITAALPARDAARSSPLVALTRSDADANAGWPLWLRLVAWLVGGAALGAGLAALLASGITPIAIGAGGGAAVALLVWLLPFALSGLVSITTRLLIGSSPALRSLTALRSRRARSRAAATTAALLIATAVVAGLSTLSSTFVASVSDQVSHIVRADLVVDSGTFTRGGLPETLVSALGRVPGVTASSGLRIGTAAIDQTNFRLTGVDGADAFKLLNLGLPVNPGRLDDSGILVSSGLADQLNLSNGQSVNLEFNNADVPMHIEGIFTAQSILLGDAVITSDLLNRVTPSSRAYFELLNIGGTNKAATVKQIEQVAHSAGVDAVYAPTQLVAHRADVISGFERVIQWMLLFSVAIAVIGVANTLQLSVNERRRELGLLRAVGGSPGQVIRLVLVEAAALSIVGSLVGTAIGLGAAYGAFRALGSLGLQVFAVPILVVAGTAVAAFALGLFGAWLPAVAASRTGVMDALGEDADQGGSGFFDRIARHRTARTSRRVDAGPATGPPEAATIVAPPATAQPEAPAEPAPEREGTMAHCYECGNDPGDGERCIECGAMQIREPAGMFSTAPTAQRQAAAPPPTVISSSSGSNGRWSTGDGSDSSSPRSSGRDHEDIVDAAVIDDDDHVVNLGSIHDSAPAEPPAPRSSGSAGPPPEPGPRTPPPENSRAYRAMPPPPEGSQDAYRQTAASGAGVIGGETFGAPPSHSEAVLVTDPQGISAAISRLAPSSQQNGAAGFMVAAALLGPDERVLVAVQGWSHGMPAVAVLTTMRAVVVCERQWKPVVEHFPLRPSLAVFGRHLDGRASMTFQDTDRTLTLDQIADVALAVELAEATRAQSTRNSF